MQHVGTKFSTSGARKHAISRGRWSCHVAHFHGYFTRIWLNIFEIWLWRKSSGTLDCLCTKLEIFMFSVSG